MKGNEELDDRLREYLLRRLSEDAMEQLERKLMTEDGDFQELLIEENELIDDYVRDELCESDRLRFESHFLCTPERRRKLRFAATLREYLRIYWTTAPPHTGTSESLSGLKSFWDWLFKLIPHPTPAWGAVSGALVLAIATGVWATVGYLRTRDRLEVVSAERGSLLQERQTLQQQLAVERARAEESARTQAPPREEAGPPTTPHPVKGSDTVSFSLAPGLLRGAGELARIRVPSDSSLVVLNLDIGLDEYPRYRAVLHEAAGDEIWTQSKLEARTVPGGAVVILTLPSQLLAPGDYYVKIEGVSNGETTEGLGRYDFRVIRE